jgi:DNA invertase Pin-like site-specific DNA recombinase
MDVRTAVAEFERDLLIEHTQSGLAGAKSRGQDVGP